MAAGRPNRRVNHMRRPIRRARFFCKQTYCFDLDDGIGLFETSVTLACVRVRVRVRACMFVVVVVFVFVFFVFN